MRLPNIALVCLLITACPAEDHVVPDPMPDAGDGDGDNDPTDDGETTGQAACEAAGGTWEECPPNADCTFWCKLPEETDDGEPDGDDDDVADDGEIPDDDAGVVCSDLGESECNVAACAWTECPPNADCTFSCIDETQCEARGGSWQECPPNADCAFNFRCDLSGPDPKPGAFACGPQKQCAAGEFCEVVASDVPEFETGYNRYACRQMPECDLATCECLELQGRCAIWDIEVTGTCTEPSAGAFTLTCGVGG